MTQHKHTATNRQHLLLFAVVLTAAFGMNVVSASLQRTSQDAFLLHRSSVSSGVSSHGSSSLRVAAMLHAKRAPLITKSSSSSSAAMIAHPLRRRAASGALLHGAAVSSTRTLIKAACGDKLITQGEQCDDGNTIAGDGCSLSCQIETGFNCDTSQPTHCWSRCGDGIVAANEKCDDGNTIAGDGCTASCKVEFFYTCAGSPSVCAIPARCGNGIVEGSEACDDGNSTPGDGCTNSCTLE